MKIKKIYLDMDGVLADFDRGCREICGVEPAYQDGKPDEERDDRMWQEIRKTSHFYDRLELMPGAKEMFDRLRERYGDRIEILTGVPRKERGIVTAEEDKRKWTRRVLSEDVTVHTVCRKHKQNYCKGPEYFLIDDREKTILEWEARGGTGILHRGAEETMKTLEEKGVL